MNIPYTTITRTSINGTDKDTHLDDLKTALIDSGWSLKGETYATQYLTIYASWDGTSITIGSITYTFKNTLTGAAYEVKTGVNQAATALNLVAAVNDSGVEGTDYGTGTAAHPDVTAAINGITSNRIDFTAIAGGTDGNAISPVSSTDGGLAWGASYFSGGGWILISAADHPCKYRVCLKIYTSGTTIRYTPSSEAMTDGSDAAWLSVGSGINYWVRATPYDAWIIRPGTRDFFYVGALWNPAEWGPTALDSVTQGSATTLTYAAAHGLNTGDMVTLSQFSGDSNWLSQNGKSYAVTVVDATSVTIVLDSTSFASPTVGYAGSKFQVGASLLACGSSGPSHSIASFRWNLAHSGATFTNSALTWSLYNDSTPAAQAQFGSQSGNVRIMCLCMPSSGTYGAPIGRTGYFLYQPAMISHGVTTHATEQAYFVGCMWNAIAWLGTSTVDNDLDQISLDGRKFYNITDRTGAGASQSAGCLFIEVPEVA